MASREENLKKINDELEALSDEELDKIAGGAYNEVAGDSRFLNDLGNFTDRYGATRTFFHYDDFITEVSNGWKKFGITMSPSWAYSNKYFKDGKEISRNDAMRIAAGACGKDISSMHFTDY